MGWFQFQIGFKCSFETEIAYLETENKRFLIPLFFFVFVVIYNIDLSLCTNSQL